MNEKIYLLNDKNSFPYGIFTNVNLMRNLKQVEISKLY